MDKGKNRLYYEGKIFSQRYFLLHFCNLKYLSDFTKFKENNLEQDKK